MTHTLEWRKNRALDFRAKGANCAQAVILAFPDITNLDDTTALRLTSALGSGVAATREICGVANAMAIVAGYAATAANANDKVLATRSARPLIDEFSSQNCGMLRCADLKGPNSPRPCNDLIIQGIEILHNNLCASAN